MATIRTPRTGRTWLGRPTHSVVITDPTGKIAFHGYSRKEAEALARTIAHIIGGKPVGELAHILAYEVLGYDVPAGQVWNAKL